MPASFPDTSLTHALLALRPSVETEPLPLPADDAGTFMHQTLRPILKLQNGLLLTLVADFLREHHVPFASAVTSRQHQLVTDLLTRNVKLRYTIIGLISGLFTPAETAFYRQHRAELNRRLLELALRRVTDQLSTVVAHMGAEPAAFN